jgi:hypothetical protein
MTSWHCSREHRAQPEPDAATALVEVVEMTAKDEPQDGLLLAMRDLGHDPVVSAMNGSTGYMEATCNRCSKRSWGWYFARSGSYRIDIDGPAVKTPCIGIP